MIKFRSIATAAALAAGMLAAAPSHAAGGIWGSAAITSGCGGGSVAISAINTMSNNWIFDVTVVCTNAAPQHVLLAGSWNAAVGGNVVGFGSGALQIGIVGCGSNSNVAVKVTGIGAPTIHSNGSITRSCL